MKIGFSAEDEAFRQEVADWLQSLVAEMQREAARARKEIRRRGRGDQR